MKLKNIRIIFLSTTIVTILIVLSFSGVLNITSFKKNYTESLVTSYKVAGGEVVRKIEYAVKYGKKLDDFYGIKNLLLEVKQDLPEIENVRIVSSSGKVYYSLSDMDKETAISQKQNSEVSFKEKVNQGYKVLVDKNKYHIFIPIQDKKGEWISSLDIIFDQSVINKSTNKYLYSSIIDMIIIALVTLGLLLITTKKVSLITEEGEIKKKNLTIAIIIILSFAQLAYALENVSTFRKGYIEIAKNNTALSTKIIQKNINYVIGKGVDYKNLYGVEEWLKKIVTSVPELDSINLTDKKGNSISKVKGVYSEKNSEQGNKIGSEFLYELPLQKDSSGVEEKLNVVLSKNYIDSKIKEIIMDACTILVTSFFFMVEIILFMLIFLRNQINKAFDKHNVKEEKVNFKIVRPIAFIFFIATNMSASFIPVMMKNFNHSILGIPENIVLGLPVSVEVFTSILSTIITGYVLDKKGWKKPFLIGLILIAIGSFMSGIAGNALLFIIARGVSGIGYGFSWMALRGFVAAAPTEAERSEGFSALNAGIYAGINCSVVLGAMLSERIGYSKVFFIALIITIVALLFTLMFTRNSGNISKSKAISAEVETNTKIDTKGTLLGLLNSKLVLAFFLLVAIPSSIGLMFLNYFLPVFAKSINVSSSNTGRVFLVYGLCVVYLGPFFSKYIGKKISVNKANIAANFLCAASLIIFALGGNFPAAVIAVFILGLSDSIGLVAQNNYFLNLDEVNSQGKGIALSVFSIVKKVGQMAGPIIFGASVTMGMKTGVGLIGISFAIALVLFIIVEKITLKRKINV